VFKLKQFAKQDRGVNTMMHNLTKITTTGGSIWDWWIPSAIVIVVDVYFFYSEKKITNSFDIEKVILWI